MRLWDGLCLTAKELLPGVDRGRNHPIGWFGNAPATRPARGPIFGAYMAADLRLWGGSRPGPRNFSDVLARPRVRAYGYPYI